jgi:HK97 family phage prohead protease
MSTETKHIITTATLKAEGEDEGSLEAVISTFHVVDRDGDIVLPSAFKDGEEIPMVWSHDWQMPIGKGRIRVTDTQAIFEGRLNLNTDWGRNAYESIKFMGPLQEYSWGFQVLESDIVERDGEKRRAIVQTERFEASPVLVGAAGRNRTGTLAIKSLADSTLTERLPLDDHAAAVLAANAALVERLQSHADLKTRPTATHKEGRILSEANRERIKTHAESARAMADDLDALYTATTPAPKDDGKAARALRGEALRQIAAIHLIAS